MMKRFLLNLIQKRGFMIFKHGVTDKISVNYRKIFSHFGINTIIDIGANEGQYANSMHMLGFGGRIISFEPLKMTYGKLKKNASGNSNWETVNIALGDKDGEEYINVAKNTHSSSLLEMLPSHVEQEPESVYVNKEKITVKKLDSIFDNYINKIDSVYLKLDVQGFEKNLIEGASDSLKKVKLIQLEISIIPLYKGELLLADMINYMDQKGFQLYSLIPGFFNFETGQLFQTDGIFVRKDLAPTLKT
jgi:FkbM family methyltransferase